MWRKCPILLMILLPSSMLYAQPTLEIDSTPNPAIMVHHSDSVGLTIHSADHDGIHLGQISDDGIHIESTGDIGILMQQTQSDGIFIGNAGGSGISIASVGNPSGQEIPEGFKNGLMVLGAEDHGLFVGRADDDAVRIESAGDNGLLLLEAQSDGINIGQVGLSGVSVSAAGNPSTQAFPQGFKSGFLVLGAENDGLFVGRADDDGVRIESAGRSGIHVESAAKFGISASGLQAAGYFDGKVGIGTTTPTFPLTIHDKGDAMTGNNVDISELSLVLNKGENINAEATGLGFQSAGNQNNIGAAIIHERTGTGSIGKLHFATKIASGEEADIPIHMTLDDDGELGIGTTSPQAPLHIGGGSSSEILLDNQGDISWKNSTGLIKPVLTLHSDNNVYLDATTNNTSKLIFRTNIDLHQQMIISEDGDVDFLNGNVDVHDGHVTISNGDLDIASGDVDIASGDLDVTSGDLRLGGELNHLSTGSAHMLPICYGIVDINGHVEAGSGNFSVTDHDANIGFYQIAIENVTFDASKHIVNVTPYGVGFSTATYREDNGQLKVDTKQPTVPPTPAARFSFVVYEP